MATAADGTNPTGMHSCFTVKFGFYEFTVGTGMYLSLYWELTGALSTSRSSSCVSYTNFISYFHAFDVSIADLISFL